MNKTFVYVYEKDNVKNVFLSGNEIEGEDFQLCSIEDFQCDTDDCSIFVLREGVFQYSKELQTFVRVV